MCKTDHFTQFYPVFFPTDFTQ